MRSKAWEEITDPFPHFNGCTFEVWECISNFVPQFIMDFSIVWLKLIHFSENTQSQAMRNLNVSFVIKGNKPFSYAYAPNESGKIQPMFTRVTDLAPGQLHLCRWT